MIAPDALASSTSLSVMAPTPRWTTSTRTSLVLSWASASASASAGPPWSALMMMRSAATPPSLSARLKSSRLVPFWLRRFCASRSSRCRFCAISRASLASVDDREGVARRRHALEAEDLHRNRRAGLLHRLAALVEQRAHAAGELAADEVVADRERAASAPGRWPAGPCPDRACASSTAPWPLPSGLALRSRISAWSRICSSSVVDAGALLGRDLGGEHVAAELLEHDAVLQQVLLDLLRVGRGQVDLVDRDDHRHAGVLGVADRLDRLRHDLVVGRDDEDDDVGHLGAAGAHGGERLVARRVEEGDRLAARQRRRGTRRCAG